jgi:hypothetical protein
MDMRLGQWTAIFMVCWGLVCGGAAAARGDSPAAGTRLSYHLPPAGQITTLLHWESRVTQTESGWTAVRDLAADLRLDCSILKAAAAGGTLCRIRVAEVSVRERTPFEDNEASASRVSGMLSAEARGLAQLAGLAFTIEFPPSGAARLVAEENRNEGLAKLDPGKLETMDGLALLTLLFAAENNPWKETLQELLVQLFNFWPQREAIAAGDSWKADLDLPFVRLPLRGEVQTAVAALGPETVELKASAPLAQELEKNDGGQADGTPGSFGSVHYQLRGDLDGRLQVDTQSGWLRQAAFDARLTGEVRRSSGAVPVTLTIRFEWQTVDGI